LENNEFCLLINAGILKISEARIALEKSIPRFDEYVKKGQIEIISYNLRLTVGGDSEAIKSILDDKAILKGFDGLRLAYNAFNRKNDEESHAWRGDIAFQGYNVIAFFIPARCVRCDRYYGGAEEYPE
jgi:hypothetical protein